MLVSDDPDLAARLTRYPGIWWREEEGLLAGLMCWQFLGHYLKPQWFLQAYLLVDFAQQGWSFLALPPAEAQELHSAGCLVRMATVKSTRKLSLLLVVELLWTSETEELEWAWEWQAFQRLD